MSQKRKPQGENARAVITPLSHHFDDDHDQREGRRHHSGTQPGAEGADIDDIHPEREGYDQPESQKGLSGDGHDERGDYGRGPPPGAHKGDNAQKK